MAHFEDSPHLYTERLEIRLFRPSDWPDFYEYMSLPEIYEFEPGEVINTEDAQVLCLERSKGRDFWAVVDKEEKKLLGHFYTGQSGRPEFHNLELGYIFNPRYQKKAYASEAGRRLLEYLFTQTTVRKIVAHCDPLNPASWRLLERLGLRREAHFKQHAFFRYNDQGEALWHDCYSYGLLKTDWLLQHSAQA